MKQNPVLEYQGERDSDIITIWSYIKSSKKFYLQSARHFINHTLRNILYKDINWICPKFNEYTKLKKITINSVIITNYAAYGTIR